jgi:hypothetical protein
MRGVSPEDIVLKRISLDWWAVIAALTAAALVKTVNLPVGW